MKNDDILDDIFNQSDGHKAKRPIAITVICVLAFIGAAISLPFIFTSAAQLVGSWYPPYSGHVHKK
jgi:hypothetical protein